MSQLGIETAELSCVYTKQPGSYGKHERRRLLTRARRHDVCRPRASLEIGQTQAGAGLKKKNNEYMQR
jgi:hypothetical protein